MRKPEGFLNDQGMLGCSSKFLNSHINESYVELLGTIWESAQGCEQVSKRGLRWSGNLATVPVNTESHIRGGSLSGVVV